MSTRHDTQAVTHAVTHAHMASTPPPVTLATEGLARTTTKRQDGWGRGGVDRLVSLNPATLQRCRATHAPLSVAVAAQAGQELLQFLVRHAGPAVSRQPCQARHTPKSKPHHPKPEVEGQVVIVFGRARRGAVGATNKAQNSARASHSHSAASPAIQQQRGGGPFTNPVLPNVSRSLFLFFSDILQCLSRSALDVTLMKGPSVAS